MRFEEELKQKIESIEARYYITVVSVFVCGLLAHLYQFTNKNFNYDELGQTPAGFGAGVSLGRWGLQLIGDTVGFFFRTYSIPMVNGMITLLFIALSSAYIVKAFDITDKVCCSLIGGILATFPALVSTYFFMFTAPYYGCAMLLSCMAGCLFIEGADKAVINKYSDKKLLSKDVVIKGLAGLACLTLATAIYQSYCSVTLCILLIDVVLDFYNNGEILGDNKGNGAFLSIIVVKGVAYCIEFGISLGFYLVGTKVAVNITGIQLDDYRGMSSIGSMDIRGLIMALKTTYKNWLLLMTPRDVYQINPIYVINFIFIILNGVLLLYVIRRLLKDDNVIKKMMFMLLVGLLPVATFFPEMLTQGVGGVYSIMTYSSAFTIILPIVLYDRTDVSFYNNNKDYVGRIMCPAVFMCILVYIWFANGNYQVLQYTTYHDLAYFETLATQVKSLDGYEADMPVAFVGGGFNDPTFSSGGLMDSYFDIEGKWPTNVNYFNNVYLWTSYLGYTPEIIEFRDSYYLKEIDEINKMPCYPNDGSIAIIDGMVVIKASE